MVSSIASIDVKWLTWSLDRFHGRRNTMIVFMYRPSPQVPEPSVDAARRCYEASVFNVAMHREQIATRSVDLTWIFTQSLFMALNTILWSFSYPEIRREHPVDEARAHLDVALEAIILAAERWPGVESALLLYKSLVAACLKAYNTEESFVVHSPSSHPTPGSGPDVATPPSMSSPSSTTTSYHSQNVGAGNVSATDNVSTASTSRGSPAGPTLPTSHASISSALAADTSEEQYYQPWSSQGQRLQMPLSGAPPTPYTTQSYAPSEMAYPNLPVDRATPYNAFPSIVPGLPGWDPNFALASTTACGLAYVDAAVDPANWMGPIGDQYSQYFNGSYPAPPWRERTLSQQEQVELMASLEKNVPDVSAQLVNDSATFYQS